MQRPPRRRGERLLDAGLLLRSYAFLGILEAAGAMAAFFAVLVGAGWSPGDALSSNDPLYLRATTACLATVVVMQVANVFLCRDDRAPLASRGLFENPLLLAGVGAELLLLVLIVYTSPGHAAFGTTPLRAGDWLATLPLALLLLGAEELRKAIARRSPKPPR